MILLKLQLHISWGGNTCCEPSTGEQIHWKQVSSSSQMFTTTMKHIVIVPQATSANMLAILSTNAISSKDNKGDSVQTLGNTTRMYLLCICRCDNTFDMFRRKAPFKIKQGNPPLMLHYSLSTLQRKLLLTVSIY